jgi:hypothetical protein
MSRRIYTIKGFSFLMVFEDELKYMLEDLEVYLRLAIVEAYEKLYAGQPACASQSTYCDFALLDGAELTCEVVEREERVRAEQREKEERLRADI